MWAFESGFTDGGLQAAPLVIDGVMYVSTAWNHVFALDAATGERLWRYDYPEPEAIPGTYGTWNRGVAVAYGLVFMGTLDNHVVALDRETGEEVWRVEVENSKQCGCNITSAPLVVKDIVITGVTGGDSAHRGYLNAFDAKTGRHRWRFWDDSRPGRARPRFMGRRFVEVRGRLDLGHWDLRCGTRPALLGCWQSGG